MSQNLAGRNRRLQKLHLQCADCSGAGSICLNPELIWNYVNQNITDIPEEEYNTLCASPIGCLKLKMGSAVSRTILFIAICRSLNIPARLDKSLMLPEYWADGAFHVPVSRAQASRTLLLRNILGKEWIYAQHWTLGRLERIIS